MRMLTSSPWKTLLLFTAGTAATLFAAAQTADQSPKIPGKGKTAGSIKTHAPVTPKPIDKPAPYHKKPVHSRPAPIHKPSPPSEEKLPFLAADGTKTNSRDGAEMVHIPAGWFWMGYKDQKDNPRRKVHVEAYWIYKNLVTVGQYKKFCEASKGTSWEHKMPSAPDFNKDWAKEDHPMVNVSWEDAVAYGKWAFGDDTNHLSTEAQWEKAARGTDGRKFPWKGDWDGSKCANSVKPYDLKGTVSVGSYPQGASPYGLNDMAGNVLQWCEDWYDNEHKYRVLRGGSWNFVNEDLFRASIRFDDAPAYRNKFIGFRCASGL